MAPEGKGLYLAVGRKGPVDDDDDCLQERQLATPRNVVVDGEVLATHQGIITGVEDPVIDEQTASE